MRILAKLRTGSVVFACWLPACLVCGQDGDPATVEPTIAALVHQLGATSFQLRENAANELLRHGLAAKPALVAASHNPDLEIRLSAARLLTAIARADFERRLITFVEDPRAVEPQHLPGWLHFQDIVGPSRKARELYAEMLRAERALLEALQQGEKRAASQFVQRFQAIQSGTVPGTSQQISTGSLAALLLVGVDVFTLTGTTMGYQMFGLLNHSSAVEAVTAGPQSGLLKRLVASWLDRCVLNEPLARSGLILAQRYAMNDVGLDLARRLIQRDDVSASTLPYAVLIVGKFGGPADVSRLEPLLSNTSVCHSWHPGGLGNVVRIQVRDVVLATLIHLTGQEHKEYGFEHLQEYELTLFHIYTCGFAEERQRVAALAKWRQWTQKRNSS